MIQTELFLLLIGVSAAQEILRVKAMESVGYLWKEHKSALIFCGAASLVWSGVTVLSEVPVYLSLLLYFLLWYLPYLRVHINGKMIQTFSMIGYLHLSSFYLMFLGAASIGRGSVRNINLQSSVKASGYLTAKIVLCIFYIIWIRYFSGKNVKEEHTDYKKSKIFLLFLWSCLVYEMIDSILASFFSDNVFVPALMISGNALILLLTFLFMRHNYLIVREQYLEERYRKMEEAKARKLLREEQMTRMAKTDSLTGAYARGYGIELLKSFLKQNKLLTAVYMDLDGLKEINDSKGHSVGDVYLKTFAEEMKKNLKKDELLIRFGGDEFLAVFPGIGSEETKDKMERIRREMEHPEKDRLPIHFSFGAVSGQKTPEELIKEADQAMYSDKHNRKEERDTGCPNN